MAKPAKKKRMKDGGALVHISPHTAGIMFDGATLEDWDDDELLAGRRKNKNGSFVGRKPKLIPIELHRELTKRRMQRAHAILAHSLVDAAKMLRAVVNDKRVRPSVRIQAAELMFNRILGKPKEQVVFDMTSSGEVPAWQRIVAQAIINDASQIPELEAVSTEMKQDEDVIEGEVVEQATVKSKRKKQPAKKRKAAVS